MSYETLRRLSCTSLALIATALFSPANAQCSADPWADVVVASSTTPGDPTSVLGPPDGVLADFEEVGSDPGFVTVAFVDDVIVDGPGADFALHVVDFPQSESVEAFELLVSEDGATFVSLGMTFPTLLDGDLPESIEFDLAGSGMLSVVQVTVRGLNVDFLHQGEGVDIDAFEALNCETPVNGDLEECLDALDTCETDLGACEGDLEICDDGLGACLGDLDKGRAGLAEIRRLIGTPPGMRDSNFFCSGELCDDIRETIEMLLAPPGQNIRAGSESAKQRR